MARKTIPKEVTREVAHYVRTLKEDGLPVTAVYLYGSYAKGTERPDSDIDLFVVSPAFKNTDEALHYLWQRRVLRDPRYAIEPFGMNEHDFAQETPITREIRAHGIAMAI
jgi:uncharacterized protein